jgi:WD40 repeat protein
MKAIHLIPVSWLSSLILAAPVQNTQAQMNQGLISKSSADAKPQLVLQLGHSDTINVCAFSPDGRFALTGSSRDGTARLWETKGGRLLRSFKSDLRALAFSPDGKYVLTAVSTLTNMSEKASRNGRAILCSVETGDLVRVFEVRDWLGAVAFSPDGERVLTIGMSTATIWEVKTGRVMLPEFEKIINSSSAAFSPDGRYVVTGSIPARIWDAATGKLVREFNTYPLSTDGSVAFTPDGLRILVWTESRKAQLWNAATGTLDHEFKVELATGNAVAFSPDGRYVLTQNKGKVAQIWEIMTGKLVSEFAAQAADFTAFAFSRDGRYALAAERRPVAQVRETETAKPVCVFRGEATRIGSVSFSPDGHYLLTAGAYRSAHLWDLRTGKQERTFGPDEFGFLSAVFSPDGRYVLVSGGKYARLWEVETGRLIRQFERESPFMAPAAFSPDGRLLAGNAGGKLGIWEVESGKLIHEFELGFKDPELFYSLAFSPDGGNILIGFWKGEAQLRDVETGKLLHTLKQGDSFGYSVTFSPDGKQILTASFANSSAQLWDTVTGKLLREFTGQAGGIASVAFSPDGQYVLTGSADKTAQLWEVKTGQLLNVFAGHRESVASLAFSPDSQYVLTGSSDNTTRIWSVKRKNQLAQLVSFGNGSWVVVDSEGHFDSSDLEEINALHWIMPDDLMTPLPLEIFMRDYYEPRLLPRILNGERFDTGSVSQVNRVQPLMKILSVEQKSQSDLVTVTVETAKAESERQRDDQGNLRETGVYDLRLFRDGQLVGQYSDGTPQTPAFSASEKEKRLAWRKENEVTLDAFGKRIIKFENIRLPRKADVRQVEFSAYAFNEDRVKSQTVRNVFPIPVDLTPLKGRAYVVMFGVNAIEAECQSLDYAVNDVRKLQATFVNKLKQSGQYDEVVEIPLIADYKTEPDGKRIVAEKSATKNNLKGVFDLLSGKPVDERRLAGIPNATKLRQARPEDLLMIFFSSHGDTDGRGNFYVAPYDIGRTGLCGNADMSDEAYNQVLVRCISSEELSLWLRYVDAGEMMMIIDACHSAAAVRSDEFKPGPMGSRGLGQLAYDKRMKILAATQGDNVAREFKELNQSLLSYVLTKEGIEEERADFKPADQIVMMTEWLQYSEARVPKWYEERQKGKATPGASNQAGTARPAGDKRLVQRVRTQPIQIPSLFDFTRKKHDAILFRKGATVNK